MNEQEEKDAILKTQQIIAPEKESIKITKNTKGYNWEIRVISDKLTQEDLDRLRTLDVSCSEIWGGYSNE